MLLTLLAEKGAVVKGSSKTIAVVQAVTEETMTEAIMANTVSEGADPVAVVGWGSVVGGYGWDSVGNSGHSWSSMNSSDSWGGVVGGDRWDSMDNIGNSWPSVDSGDSWGSVVGGDGWDGVGDGGCVVGSHCWSGSKAYSVSGGTNVTSEGAGGQGKNNASADLRNKF
ncbi:hypothetical protein MTO96_019670 [Rhipicephalus appendiculatus]